MALCSYFPDGVNRCNSPQVVVTQKARSLRIGPFATHTPFGLVTQAKGFALAPFKLWGFAMLTTLRVAPVPLREFALCYPSLGDGHSPAKCFGRGLP